MTKMQFNPSEQLSFGMELEFQIVSSETGRLSPSGMAFWGVMKDKVDINRFALEATLATIEMNTSVHADADSMLEETQHLTQTLCEVAEPIGLLIRGGGTQITQFWNDRIMAPTDRAAELTRRFGYLPKRFSTYGMHVHIGVENANDVIRTGNVLQALTPLFIAMSAASPFLQLTDTGFCSSRSLEPLIYPHGGAMPKMENWEEFEGIADEIFASELATSLKDIYWDVRPRPDFGTIEVRVFDTPLSIKKAVGLAAFTRACAALVLDGKLALPTEDKFVNAQSVSRFLACRDALDAKLLNPFTQKWLPARDLLTIIFDLIKQSPVCAADLRHIETLMHELKDHQECKIMRDTWEMLQNDHAMTQNGEEAMLAKYSQMMSQHLLKTSH